MVFGDDCGFLVLVDLVTTGSWVWLVGIVACGFGLLLQFGGLVCFGWFDLIAGGLVVWYYCG